MEVEDSHGIRLPARETALFHLLPREELRKRIQAGVFDTIEICEDEPDRVPALGLERLYASLGLDRALPGLLGLERRRAPCAVIPVRLRRPRGYMMESYAHASDPLAPRGRLYRERGNLRVPEPRWPGRVSGRRQCFQSRPPPEEATTSACVRTARPWSTRAMSRPGRTGPWCSTTLKPENRATLARGPRATARILRDR